MNEHWTVPMRQLVRHAGFPSLRDGRCRADSGRSCLGRFFCLTVLVGALSLAEAGPFAPASERVEYDDPAVGGTRLLTGRQVAAASEDSYASSARPGGNLVAGYGPATQRVELAGGGSVSLMRADDGNWWIGTSPVENGHLYVQEGRAHVLELAGETWRPARYAIQSVAGSTGVVDGIPAIDSSLFGPCDAAVDLAGNLYVADSRNQRIRIVDSSGTISTFAGTGDWGYGGDGGPAIDAQFSFPCGVAAGAAGDVYVADVENHRVRKIDASTGVISTFAGTGDRGYGGDGGAAIRARLTRPTGVATDDAGNVYVADYGNSRVRRVDGSTGTITTLQGKRSSAPRFGGWGVAVDSSGNVYVADPRHRLVRRLDIVTGKLTTLASSIDRGYEGFGGAATWAQFVAPNGIAVDSSRNLYVADPSGGLVHRIDGITGAITILPPRRSRAAPDDARRPTWVRLRAPQGVAVDVLGNVYIADSADHRVRKVDIATQAITTVAGTGQWSYFASPDSLAADALGNLFFVDGHRVWKLDSTGTVTAFAGTGKAGRKGDGGLAVDASLRFPGGLATDAEGNVYIGECGNVRRVDTSGIITTIAGTGGRGGRLVILEDHVPALEARLNCVERLAIDGVGNMYAVESENGIFLPYLLRVDTAGTISLFASQAWSNQGWDGRPEFEVGLSNPRDLAADSAGSVYVADAGNSRILRIDTMARSVTTILETKGYSPAAVAADEAGNVYVGGGRRIRMIDAEGAVSLIAGSGRGGFSGDGEPAAGAGLSVSGMVVDPSGSVWFTDPFGRRIRVVERWPGPADLQ